MAELAMVQHPKHEPKHSSQYHLELEPEQSANRLLDGTEISARVSCSSKYPFASCLQAIQANQMAISLALIPRRNLLD
jgi:hypothetical protein